MLVWRDVFRRIFVPKARVLERFHEQLQQFRQISVRQWNSHASLRFRRTCQLIALYKQLYNERTVHGLLWKFMGRILRRRRYCSSLLMTASIFSFKDNGINDAEITRVSELAKDDGSEKRQEPDEKAEWELVMSRQDFLMWRRPLSDHPGLVEYKCAGSYHDISAAAFFAAQMNLHYRKEWDKAAIDLDVVERDAKTGSEVVRWVTHFPYPMYPREYVYVRRWWMEKGGETMVLVSKAVDHPRCPVSQEAVRVHVYSSQMVIRPHLSAKQLGFDYVLTYYDDPQSNFPSPAYRWVVKYGIPGFLDKVYHAAKYLQEASPSWPFTSVQENMIAC